MKELDEVLIGFSNIDKEFRTLSDNLNHTIESIERVIKEE